MVHLHSSLFIAASNDWSVMGNLVFFFQAEDGIRDLVRSRGLGDVYKRQGYVEPRLKGHGAWETVGQAATGLVSSPGLTVEFLSLIHI